MDLAVVGQYMNARRSASVTGDKRKNAAIRIRIMTAGMASRISAVRIVTWSTRPPNQAAPRPSPTPSTRARIPARSPKPTVLRNP